MVPTNPIEIPEIVSIVASYLTSKDLVNCLRVSKKWKVLFLPHRWKCIHVGSRIIEYKSVLSESLFGPHPADIYRHRHLIHKLTMFGDLAGLDKYIYPNLRYLVVDFSRGAMDYDRAVFLELSDMFPRAVSLVLKNVKIEETTWSTLSTHFHITTLKLESIYITSALWRACTNLECLELIAIDGEDKEIPDDVILVRLRRLYVSYVGQVSKAQQLLPIFRCPALKNFKWVSNGNDDEDDPFLIFSKPIPIGHLPQLRKLKIKSRLHDVDVASILDGVGNEDGGLITLTLEGCSFLDQSSRALVTHFSTLVYLDLKDCSSVPPSAIIRDILCSCPRLKSLFAKCTFVRDIVNCGPWVCHQLRCLGLCFRLEEGEQGLQQEFFGRLSGLINLKWLNMRCLAPAVHSEGFVEFKVGNGLGQLASLQQLKNLDCHGCCLQLGMDEVAWIKLHWRELKIRGGRFHKEQQEHDKLTAAMKLLGIHIDV